MITAIEEYFAKGCGRCERFGTPDCSARLWAEGLAELRRICLAAGLEETVKWGHPCYMHAGRNVAIFGAFRGDFRMTFLDAAMLEDPEGMLERAGPNSQVAGTLRFAGVAEVRDGEGAIAGFLAQAKAHAAAGRVPERRVAEVELPDELIAALDADPEMAEAFHALTPGRQRSHVLAVTSARAEATRIARIGKLRGRILAGKGATER